MNNYFAVVANGLEDLLEQELISLGAQDTKKSFAGVSFKSDLETAYNICLWSRLSSRIIWVLQEFTLRSDIDLYNATFEINWTEHFNSETSFVVDFNGTNDAIRNSMYGAMKVKDAIMDRFERARLPRPMASPKNADLHIHVRLVKRRAMLGFDLIGDGLHHRGYRLQAGLAPLRETHACALVLRSGWDKTKDLFDPMCGAGTLLIEAAMIAADIAPGLKRTRWGFSYLSCYNAVLWKDICQKALSRSATAMRESKHFKSIIGYDSDVNVVAIAKANAERAGVAPLIHFEVQDLYQLNHKPDGFKQGVILSNPPYGERLGEHAQLKNLYQTLGQYCKQFFIGSDAAIYSSSDELFSCLGMRAFHSFSLKNGALECRLKCYAITQKPEKKIVISESKPSISKISELPKTAVTETLEYTKNATNQAIENSDEPLTVAMDFANRLKKNIKKLEKWAKQQQISCYRLYDADIPNYNAAIDLYEIIDGQKYIIVQEYIAPKYIPEDLTSQRLKDLIQATLYTTKIQPENLILKSRQQQKGKSQYEKLQQNNQFLEITEFGLKFYVNLTDYLDTGIFLDHRLTRKMLGSMSKNCDFLNLFAYTGTATVHAACGGARSTTTVDMSNTYLNWAEKNMILNNQKGDKNQYIQADCVKWLAEKAKDKSHLYDLIFIDPPTFSNSKRMEDCFDIQADYINLLDGAKKLLKDNGNIIFSNNKQNFKMDEDALFRLGLHVENLNKRTLPLDYINHPQIHNCWLIKKLNK